MAQQQLVEVLRGTLSPKAEIRRQAEQLFMESWLQRPLELFPLLCEMMASGVEDEVRCVAAVLFRRWIDREIPNAENTTNWAALGQEGQALCSARLLEAFRLSVGHKNVLNRVSDAIGQVATITCVYQEWPELLSAIAAILSAGQDEDEACACLRIISATPELFVSGDVLKQVVAMIVSTAIQRIQGTKLEATRALTALAIYHAEEHLDMFQAVVSQFLPAIISEGILPADQPSLVLNCAADLVFECPKLFAKGKGNTALMGQYFGLMGQIIRSVPADEYCDAPASASAALEFICAAVEGNGSFFRRSGSRGLVEQAAQLLLEATAMEDGSNDWLETDPQDEADVESVSVVGQQSLDRFALALGGAAVGQVMFSLIGAALNRNDPSSWREKFAALMAVASVAEGCADEFLADHLDGLLALLWPQFSSQQAARVQYAACHALGQLCTDFPGRIQAEHATAALTALVGLLAQGDQLPGRVLCHASAALVNFAEGCEPDMIAPFLDGILGNLVKLLSSSCAAVHPYLQEQLIATIAAYSEAAKSRFVHYYPAILPHFQAALGASRRQVQCRAVEGLSLLFTAVGKDVSQSNLPAFLQHLEQLQAQEAEWPADDTMREFLPAAWLRMAQHLGAEFAPWLSVVLPHLLQVIQAPLDFRPVENDAGQEDDADGNDNVELVRVNGKTVGLNTSALDEKAGALDTLTALLQNVGVSGVSADVARVAFDSVLPLVNFEWSVGVRAGAVEAGAAAIESLAVHSLPDAATRTANLVQAIIDGLSDAYDAEFAAAALDSLAVLVTVNKKAHMQLFNAAEFITKMYRILPAVLQFALDRIVEYAEEAATADADDEEDQDGGDGESNEGYVDAAADEEEVIYAWGRLQATIFEHLDIDPAAHGWSLIWAANQLRPLTAPKKPASKNKKPARLQKAKQNAAPEAVPAALHSVAVQHAALGVLCDAVRLLNASLLVQVDGIGQALVDGCLAALTGSKAAPLVKQVGAHLAGLLGQYSGPAFRDFCLQASWPLLERLATKSNARAPSQLNVTENAVSSLCRIADAYPQDVNLDQLLNVILPAALPVLMDEDEVEPVAVFLMKYYTPSAPGSATILAATVKAFVTHCSTPSHEKKVFKAETQAQVQQFLHTALTESPAQQQILAGLSPEQRMRLN